MKVIRMVLQAWLCSFFIKILVILYKKKTNIKTNLITLYQICFQNFFITPTCLNKNIPGVYTGTSPWLSAALSPILLEGGGGMAYTGALWLLLGEGWLVMGESPMPKSDASSWKGIDLISTLTRIAYNLTFQMIQVSIQYFGENKSFIFLDFRKTNWHPNQSLGKSILLICKWTSIFVRKKDISPQ